LSENGFSSREIAKEIFGDKIKRKSTINDFLYRTKIEPNKSYSKILFLDIETAPSSGFYFGNRYEINISQDQVISESFILTYSVKYLGSDRIIYGALNYSEVKAENDFRIVSELYDLLNDADIIVAHNGKQFDIKVINARLIFNGFPPPTPYKVVDTLLIARRAFKFPSNKLDSLCHYLGLDVKKDTGGFKLWKGYMHGDTGSMDKMVEYNHQDVFILEQVYFKLRAWDTTHPNLNIYKNDGVDVCPCCGAEEYKETGKRSHTNVCSYETFRCTSCGKIFKKRKNVLENRVPFVNCV
jgi:DNA polymerase elongation subunit (family B)